MKHTHTIKDTKGFTLIETLVGLTIFLIAFVALSQTSADSLADIIQTKRRLVASYLAEEGIEYVKQIQKSYVLQGKTKDQFLDFVDANCSLGCDFYIGNFETSLKASGAQLDPQGVWVFQNTDTYDVGASGGGAQLGEIGVATLTVSNTMDSIPPMQYYPYGLIALAGLYDTQIADSEYTRIITIENIATQDPSQSRAVLVTSTVYIKNQISDTLVNEKKVVLTNIMHFNFN